MRELLRRNRNALRPTRLRCKRINGEGVLREYRRPARCEKRASQHFQQIIRAVAHHDLRRIDAEFAGYRRLQVKRIAIGVARQIRDFPLNRRARQWRNSHRVFIGGELDDLGFVKAVLARNLGNGLARLIRRDSAHIGR